MKIETKKKKKRGAVDNFDGIGWFVGRGVLIPLRTMNYHDDKMHNTVVPPKILLHKKNTK